MNLDKYSGLPDNTLYYFNIDNNDFSLRTSFNMSFREVFNSIHTTIEQYGYGVSLSNLDILIYSLSRENRIRIKRSRILPDLFELLFKNLKGEFISPNLDSFIKVTGSSFYQLGEASYCLRSDQLINFTGSAASIIENTNFKYDGLAVKILSGKSETLLQVKTNHKSNI